MLDYTFRMEHKYTLLQRLVSKYIFLERVSNNNSFLRWMLETGYTIGVDITHSWMGDK